MKRFSLISYLQLLFLSFETIEVTYSKVPWTQLALFLRMSQLGKKEHICNNERAILKHRMTLNHETRSNDSHLDLNFPHACSIARLNVMAIYSYTLGWKGGIGCHKESYIMHKDSNCILWELKNLRNSGWNMEMSRQVKLPHTQ